MRFKVKTLAYGVLLALLASPSLAQADLANGYVMESTAFSAGYAQFTAHDGKLHAWNTSLGYQVYDVASGATQTIGKPSNGTFSNHAGDPFGVLDPINDVFYAGAFYSNDASYIYAYDRTDGSWSTDTTGTQAGVQMINAYGAQVHNGQLYVSGLAEPWTGGFGQDTYIFAFDHTATPGGDSPRHDVLLENAGNSAYLAIGPNGDFYYGSYDFSDADGILYHWTAAQVASVTDDLYAPDPEDHFLPLAEAEVLMTLPGDGNGLAVDENGNVFFAVNDYSPVNQGGMPTHTVGMVDPSAPGGYREILVIEDWMSHVGALSVDGDFLNGGTLYLSGYGSTITAIQAVPEPTTMCLLLLGMLCWIGQRRGR